jgi:hypothetical protein
MTQPTLFADPAPQTEIDETKDYLSEFVGEGKKYRDAQALAKAVAHKDAFIEQLKAETAGMRQDLQTRLKMEDFLAKLAPPPAPTSDNQAAQRPAEQTATKEELLKLLEEREAAAARQRNLTEAKETLQKTFGPNYASKVREVAANLNTSEAFFNDLAATNPAALYKLLGVGEQRPQSFEAPRLTYLRLRLRARSTETTRRCGKSVLRSIGSRTSRMKSCRKHRNRVRRFTHRSKTWPVSQPLLRRT